MLKDLIACWKQFLILTLSKQNFKCTNMDILICQMVQACMYEF
jgi:hypothetical protein